MPSFSVRLLSSIDETFIRPELAPGYTQLVADPSFGRVRGSGERRSMTGLLGRTLGTWSRLTQ